MKYTRLWMAVAFTLSVAVFIAGVAPTPHATHAQDTGAELAYAELGAFSVGFTEVTIDGPSQTMMQDDDRTLRLGIWYPAASDEGETDFEYLIGFGVTTPSGIAIADAPPTADPTPLVVMSHGLGASPYLYTNLLERIASYGYIVVGVEHTGNTIIDATLTPALFAADIAPMHGIRTRDVGTTLQYILDSADFSIDTARIAVLGHSFGGLTVVQSAGARVSPDNLDAWCAANSGAMTTTACFPRDARDELAGGYAIDFTPQEDPWPADLGTYLIPDDIEISALVMWSPWNAQLFGVAGLAPVEAPTLVFGGTADAVTPYERDIRGYYEMLNTDIGVLVTVQDGGHNMVVDDCPPIAVDFGLEDSCTNQNYANATVRNFAAHSTIAFLEAMLRNDETARAALLNMPAAPVTVESRGLE